MPKKTIFISHRGAEQAVADTVIAALRDLGHDSIDMGDWIEGDDFIKKMEAAFAEGDAMVALVSPAYFESAMCERELRVALRLHDETRPGFLTIYKIAPVDLPDLYSTLIFGDFTEGVDPARLERKFGRVVPKLKDLAGGPLTNLPPLPTDHFVDLPDAVAALDAALLSGNAAITQAIQGLGGVGKTTLARHYAGREAVAARFPVRWWVNAETAEGARRDIAGLAAALGLATKETAEDAAVALALEWLGAPDRPAMLIFDNAEEETFDRALLPQGPGAAAALITTRQRDFGGLAEVVALETWPADIAARFLMDRSDRADETGARDLAEALGGLALACEQAGAFCRRTGRTPAEYLALFTASPARALDRKDGAPSYPDSVAKTFALAIDKAAAEAPAARAMLSVIAALAPAPVPLAIFGHGAAPEGLRDPVDAADAEAALTRWALADPARVRDDLRDAEAPCLSLHRLVREAARAGDAGRTGAALAAAVRAMGGAVPDDLYTNYDRLPLLQALAPHCDPAWAGMGLKDDAAKAGCRCLDAARYDAWARGDHRRAAPYAAAAVALAEAAFGADDLEVAAQLSNQSIVLGDLGGADNLTRARAALERALRIGEATLGPDHPDVAIHLSNLATVLRYLGGADNLTRARAALERALRIGEAAHGPDHPNVAIRLSNLANVLLTLGGADNLTRARAALERAIRIDEAAHGPDHPNVGIRLINLCGVLEVQGDRAGALAAARRGAAIFEAALGPDHGSTKNAAGHVARLSGPA